MQIDNDQPADDDQRPVVDPKQIQYTIALDLSEYRPLQEIIVRSTIKNVGESTIVVPEPSEKAMYVGHEVLRKNGEELEIVRQLPELPESPLWNAHIVRLAPGQSASLSSELNSSGPAGFDPGEYVFRARYYPDRSPLPEGTPFVQSNQVPFRVRSHTPEEEVEWKAIIKARADFDIRSIFDGVSARAFLQRYPNSIYRSLAFSVLGGGRFYEKDWTGQLEFMRPEREALNSDTFSDLSYYEEALVLERMGDVKAAVKLLRETKGANSSGLREGLEAKYGPFPADPLPPAPQPPAPAPIQPRQSLSMWLAFGILLGVVVLLVLRQRKQSGSQRK